MGAAEPLLASDAATIDGLGAAVLRELGPLVGRVDREGLYPGDALRAFGRLRAYDRHLASLNAERRCDLVGAIDAITVVGETCGASAFMAWCQDAAGWYVEHGGSETLRTQLLPKLARGEVLGGTGMSNPMKYFASIERLALSGRRVAGGFVVNGRLPWVSNLGHGHVFGSAFRVDEGGAAGGREVMAMFDCDWPGLTLAPVPPFLAMDGTGTWACELVDVFVPDAHVLADPIGPYLRRIRNGFVLLQVGIGAGIIKGCIDAMRESNLRLAHVNEFLEDGPDEIEDALLRLHARVGELGQRVLDPSDQAFADVLTARLVASELTLRATQSAMLHAGALGYSMGSPVQRRLREGWFVAIVTPAIKHLRKEIDRLHSIGAVS